MSERFCRAAPKKRLEEISYFGIRNSGKRGVIRCGNTAYRRGYSFVAIKTTAPYFCTKLFLFLCCHKPAIDKLKIIITHVRTALQQYATNCALILIAHDDSSAVCGDIASAVDLGVTCYLVVDVAPALGIVIELFPGRTLVY